jgi:hypothetical protein
VQAEQDRALATGSCRGTPPTEIVTLDSEFDGQPVETFGADTFVATSQWRGEMVQPGSDDYLLLMLIVDASVTYPSCPGFHEDIGEAGDFFHQAWEEAIAPLGEVPAIDLAVNYPGADSAAPVLFVPFGDLGVNLETSSVGVREYVVGTPGQDYTSAGLTDSAGEDGGYGWLCLDRRGPIAQPGQPLDCPPSQAADWHGELFLHMEHWWYEADVPRDGMTRNMYYPIDHADCADGECAEYSYEGYHIYACDGIDNDLDGFIDEGSEDVDGDGVGDCATQ